MLTYALYTVVALLVAILATISIWSPRMVRIKLAALIVSAAMMPAAYAGFSELLSKPKPVELEWMARQVAEADVVAADMQEGEAIYLWLKYPGSKTPRAYVLPWSEQAARQLHGAQQKAEQEGSGVRMGKPFERSEDEDEPMFYAAPQQSMPYKHADGGDPVVVARPEKGYGHR